MPNHVHLLIKTYPDFLIGDLVWSWKKYVSSYVYSLENYKKEFEETYSPPAGLYKSRAPEYKQSFIKPASERGAPSIWQREYWERFIRDQNHFLKAVDYIHQNPVKAGLTKTAEEWLYSSAS